MTYSRVDTNSYHLLEDAAYDEKYVSTKLF